MLLSINLILFAGCRQGDNPQKKDSSEKLPIGKSADIKHNDGTSFDGSIYILQKIKSSGPTGTVESEKSFGYGISRKITNIESSGSFSFERKQIYFTTSQKIPGAENSPAGNFDYDSRKSPDSEIPSVLWTQAKETGETLTIHIASDGKVLSIDGMGSLKTNMKAKGDSLFGTQNTGVNATYQFQLDDYYSDQKIAERLNAEMETATVLKKNPGDTWDVPAPLQYGSIKSETSYKYLSDKGDLAELEITQTISLENSTPKFKESELNEETKQSAAGFRYSKVKGNSTGIIYVMKGTGWIYSGKISQSYYYKMEIDNTISGKADIYENSYTGYTEYKPLK